MPLHYPIDENLPYLDWCRGRFDKVFVALHPFFVIPGLDPADCAWENGIFVRSEAPEKSIAEIVADADRARVGLVTLDDIELLIPRRAEEVSWSAIEQATQHSGHAALNRSLLTHISALRQEFVDPAGAQRIEDHCSSSQIFLPREGHPQLLHLLKLRPLFDSTGAAEIHAANDIIDEVRKMPVAEVASPDRYFGRHLWSPDESVFVATHWDSYFTLICLREGRALPEGIEGFWADATTTHRWWL